jgi:mRNA interferase MazF
LTGLNPLPARGEVWYVNFNPTLGDEIQKLRPAIIVSSDAFVPLQTRVVVPLTTWQENFSNTQWMVKIEADKTNGLVRTSAADTLQIRCVSFKRFSQKLGKVSSVIIDEITAAIAIVIEYQ